jgi:predicted dehydrogenase
MLQVVPPTRFGLAGLGGYAAYVCDRILQEQRSGAPAAATLVAVAEPELDRFPARVSELRAAGVKVFRDYADLLAQPIDAVWLPLPIHLHLPYTEQALSAGKAVMCEKPAAGSVDEVDAMIAARDRARLPVAIGFQDLYQPSVATLKRRLLSGEWGTPLGARVIGCWPRSERYFTRNDWAGRVRRNGRWVLDSPANNALAHFLHLTLFLLGDRLDASAKPASVAAELYRANRIENYDTCSMRFAAGSGAVPVVVAFTHAAAHSVEPVIVIETDAGVTITYLSGRHIEVRAANGRVETLPLSSNPHQHMLAAFTQWVLRGADAALGSSLEMARAHVVAVNAASQAAPVLDVPPDYVQTTVADDGAPLRTIKGIVPALRACVADGCLLHETGLAPWAQPSRGLHINGYRHFPGPAAAVVSQTARIATRTLPHPTPARAAFATGSS